eukprot:10764814-Ditylum_brightwellii.AAC.1
MSQDGKTYEYVCMHVDEFCIFSLIPDDVMKKIQVVYTVKSVDPSKYYLGNNFKKDSKGCWNMGYKKYITEAVSHVELMFSCLTKHDTPMIAGNHPAFDDTKALGNKQNQLQQMLIGVLNWIVTLGRLDIVYAVS